MELDLGRMDREERATNARAGSEEPPHSTGRNASVAFIATSRSDCGQ
jgi:hypothetical protein